MGDDKVRQLERRFRETGSAEDEAAWLCERARVGRLVLEWLQVAAILGHEAAVKAGGARPGDLAAVAQATVQIHPDGPIRVAVGLWWALGEPWLRSFPQATASTAAAVIAERRVVGLAREEACYRAALEVEEQVRQLVWWADRDPKRLMLGALPGLAALLACCKSLNSNTPGPLPPRRASTLVSFALGGQDREDLRRATGLLLAAEQDPTPLLTQVLEAVAARIGDPLPPLREELVPWLLDYHDPVKQRLETR